MLVRNPIFVRRISRLLCKRGKTTNIVSLGLNVNEGKSRESGGGEARERERKGGRKRERRGEEEELSYLDGNRCCRVVEG
jgi:hypothetical protein